MAVARFLATFLTLAIGGGAAILGYHDAESLNPQYGGRVGAEWYMVDRHVALSAQGGARDATGFAELVGPTDLPLVWDASVGLRYTF